VPVGAVTHSGDVTNDRLTLAVDPSLWLFLPTARRRDRFEVGWDRTSSLAHVVEAAGIPLTEVGQLVRGPEPDAEVRVGAVQRPQRPQRPGGWAGGYVLDIHLGALARRMRLLGLDTAWPDEAGDPALVVRANAEGRVLLTQDRGLLKRRALWAGAYVRGSDPDDQLDDVLDRFRPTITPWSRCTACNGELAAVDRADVAHLLEPGTLRSQEHFAQCPDCRRVYWPGAHAPRLERVVARALEAGALEVGAPEAGAQG
jgi:uncharacterized protein with PIN domain